MSEVLSQGEVDALLRGVGDGDIETETDEAAEEVSGAVNYDLTSQEKIIRTVVDLVPPRTDSTR